MGKIVAILLLAALAVPTAKLMSSTSGAEFQFSAIAAEAGAAPISPPLMYAGIRG